MAYATRAPIGGEYGPHLPAEEEDAEDSTDEAGEDADTAEVKDREGEPVFDTYERGAWRRAPETILGDLREIADRAPADSLTDEELKRSLDIIADEISTTLPFLENTKQESDLMSAWMDMNPDQRFSRLRRLAEYAPDGTYGE